MIFAVVFPDPVHGTLYAAWGIQAFFPVFTLFGELYLVRPTPLVLWLARVRVYVCV